MKRFLLATGFFFFSLLSGGNLMATTFDFDGYLNYHNDVARFSFLLESDAEDVRVYTDSFDFGANGNFDPITALWDSEGNLIAKNDDIGDWWSYNWDSGFSLSSLEAGAYMFTIAAYDNEAAGSAIDEGFKYDGNTPVPIGEWPLADQWLGEKTGMSGYYHVVFEGVDSAKPVTVPIPGTAVLLGSGLLALIGVRKIRRNQRSGLITGNEQR
jgi:hypothetical protein